MKSLPDPSLFIDMIDFPSWDRCLTMSIAKQIKWNSVIYYIGLMIINSSYITVLYPLIFDTSWELNGFFIILIPFLNHAGTPECRRNKQILSIKMVAISQLPSFIKGVLGTAWSKFQRVLPEYAYIFTVMWANGLATISRHLWKKRNEVKEV